MDILFDNTTIRTEQTAKEINGYFYFRRPLYVVCDVLMLLCFAINVYSLISSGTYSMSAIILAPLLLVFQLFMYGKSVKTQVLRDRESFGSEPAECRYVFTDNSIICTAKGSDTVLNYSQMKKAFRTKRYIVLRSEANFLYIMSKDGFTVGDWKGFADFIKSKGIKVK